MQNPTLGPTTKGLLKVVDIALVLGLSESAIILNCLNPSKTGGGDMLGELKQILCRTNGLMLALLQSPSEPEHEKY